MRLPAFSVRHPVTTVMVFLALFLLGLISLSQLGMELFPDISFPTAVVYTAYPGVGPEEMEAQISKPIEEAVSTLNGVERISSTSSEGVSMVIVNFTWSTNMETVVSEIREKITAIEEDLPDGAERPVIVRYNPEFLPSIVVAVASSSPGMDLRRLAERQIAPALEKIEGVATVDLFGGRTAAVTCKLDLDGIARLDIPITQVLRSFTGQNVSLPAGAIGLQDRYLLLRALGEFGALEDLRNVLVGYREGVPVYLGDVAEVSLGALPREQYFRTASGDGVQLQVRKQPGYNTVELNRRVRAELKRLERELPPSLEVTVLSDQSRQILDSIGSVAGAAWQGGLLAVVVLLLFLRNIRSTLIVAVAIPVSVIATFSLMNFAGITMNVVSLMGITLGVGMFVDNAIVVLESIYRKGLAGHDVREAAEQGTSEVGRAVTASTLTTVAVFLPLVFVRDLAGLIFRDLAQTVAFALLISLAMALTLIPVMSSRLLKMRKVAAPPPGRPPQGSGEGGESEISRELEVSLADLEVHTGVAPLDRASRLIQRGLYALDGLYERAIGWALDHAVTVILVALMLLGLSVGVVFVLGMEFLPETDEGRFAISLETRVGSSFARTEGKVIQTEAVIQELLGADLLSVTSAVGRGGTMTGLAQTGSHLAILEVRLTDKDRRERTLWQIVELLGKRLPGRVLDTRFRFEVQGMAALASTATGEGEPLAVEVSGDDLERASAHAGRLAGLMRRIPGVRDVEVSYKVGKPELQLRVLRRQAASLGLTPLEIASTLRTAYKGTTVSRYRGQEGDYDVVVLLREEDRNSLAQLRKLFFVTPAGAVVPLESVVRIGSGRGPLAIQRQDRTRVVKVTAAMTGGRPLNRVVQDFRRQAARLGPPPPGVRQRISGSFQQMREAFGSLALVLVLAVALVYMVLASQFESLLHPLVVMFSVPFAVIGLAGLLLATNTTFNMMAFIGMVLLVGIVVNNAIVLLDYMNLLRRRGLGLREAIVRGGKTRLKPILMTSLTTIFGLLPMALGLGAGSEIRAPLGRAVVGGLLTSSFVTLILIPTVYWLVERRRRGTA